MFSVVVPADEAGDFLLSITHEHFAKGEEVLFANAEGIFANRIAEQQRQIVFEIAQRVDAITIDIEAGDYLLVAANQELLYVDQIGAELFKRGEISDGIVVGSRLALAAKIIVLMEFGGPYEGTGGRIGNGGYIGPIGPRHTLRISPLNGARRGAEICEGALVANAVGFIGVANVCEGITHVIQYDVENDIDAKIVGGIHKGAEFVVCVVRVAGKARINMQEIVDPVTVVSTRLERHVRENGTKPDSARAQLLDVR